MKCPRCGADVKSKFCEMCGAKMPEQNYQANNAPQPATQNFNNNFQQNNAPMQNPYQVQSQSTVKKTSNKNALAIILISLILAVILAGVGIAIYSSICYDTSLLDLFDNLTSSTINMV